MKEIRIEDLKEGMKVKLKNKRGMAWNPDGKMDRYKGRVVKILHRHPWWNSFEIKQDKDDTDKIWLFDVSDVEGIVTKEAN